MFLIKNWMMDNVQKVNYCTDGPVLWWAIFPTFGEIWLDNQ
jgi:hypothetical protein